MITFTVFPRLRQNPNEKNNPYIENFIASLNREGESTVINPPHRNPLRVRHGCGGCVFSLVLPC